MSSPTPPLPPPADVPCPRAFLPALVPGAVAALFLVTVWTIGFTHRPSSEAAFRADSVVHRVAGPSESAELAGRASRFGREARRLELRADSALARSFERAGSTDSTELKADTVAAGALRKRAGLYRQRGAGLDSAATVRDAELAKREGKRQLWVYVAALDLIVAALAALYAVAVALRRVPRCCAPGVLAKLLLPAVLAGLLFAWTWYDYAGPAYSLVGAAAGESVLLVARVSDGLHIVACTLFALGAVFAGAGLPPLDARLAPSDAERAAREVADAMHALRAGLYVGATMLVVYVAAVSTLFQWTLEFVDPAPLRFGAVQELTNGVVAARSLLASGLLLSLYGAAALMLRMMAASLSEQARPDASPAERLQWQTDQGLVRGSWVEPLKPLAAILAPAATGVVAQVLQNL